MRIYAAYYRRRYHRSPLSKLLPFAGIAIGIVVIIGTLTSVTTPKTISPVAVASGTTPVKIQATPKLKDEAALKKIIEKEMNTSIPEYSIVVDDFLRPLKVEIGDQLPFVGASIHKIPILLSIAKHIYLGDIGWDNNILFEEKDRQDYGTGSMRYKKAGTYYSIEELCSLMMKYSDNTAAYILARRVLTFDMIQEDLRQWGLTQTSMIENTTTNQDMNILLRNLATGKLFTTSLTRKILSFLHDSIYEDRIPALLPKETTVYHKIGTTIAGLHDVGIVVTPNSMYYIGIFTKGVSDEDAATQTIARISKAVFDYMQE